MTQSEEFKLVRVANLNREAARSLDKVKQDLCGETWAYEWITEANKALELSTEFLEQMLLAQ